MSYVLRPPEPPVGTIVRDYTGHRWGRNEEGWCDLSCDSPPWMGQSWDWPTIYDDIMSNPGDLAGWNTEQWLI